MGHWDEEVADGRWITNDGASCSLGGASCSLGHASLFLGSNSYSRLLKLCHVGMELTVARLENFKRNPKLQFLYFLMKRCVKHVSTN